MIGIIRNHRGAVVAKVYGESPHDVVKKIPKKYQRKNYVLNLHNEFNNVIKELVA